MQTSRSHRCAKANGLILPTYLRRPPTTTIPTNETTGLGSIQKLTAFRQQARLVYHRDLEIEIACRRIKILVKQVGVDIESNCSRRMSEHLLESFHVCADGHSTVIGNGMANDRIKAATEAGGGEFVPLAPGETVTI
jgi:hypothetical protein